MVVAPEFAFFAVWVAGRAEIQHEHALLIDKYKWIFKFGIF
jgi:uncharacterized membrane protein